MHTLHPTDESILSATNENTGGALESFDITGSSVGDATFYPRRRCALHPFPLAPAPSPLRMDVHRVMVRVDHLSWHFGNDALPASHPLRSHLYTTPAHADPAFGLGYIQIHDALYTLQDLTPTFSVRTIPAAQRHIPHPLVQNLRRDSITIFENVNQGTPGKRLCLVTQVFTAAYQIRSIK
ncbi:hypothetical protein C8R45DRAFT_1106221 [Mycena sanguinolenta]|nr:hypothetical protein C8R45DRAFT_1106221 [Mycena sanguinolenta]